MSDVALETPLEPAPPIPPPPEAAAELEAALVSTVDTSPSPLEAAAADALVPPPDPADVDAPAEPVPPVPPAPEAVAEIEAAAPQAPDDAAVSAEESDLSFPKSGSSKAELEGAAQAPAERALPFDDVEHLGVLRRSVLDALLDTEGPQTVAQILAAMPPGTTRGSAESAIKREFDAGRIERVAAGVYRLAPPKPPESPKRQSTPPPPTPDEEAMWFSAFDAWISEPETWDRTTLGPRPDEPGRRIPSAIVARGVDRSRKREARRQDRELAQARQVAADAELRTALLTACNKNYAPSLQVDDLAPVREVLKVLPLDRLLVVIRQKVDKRCFPGNPPLSSWRDPVFLEAVAEAFCRLFAVPGLVREWGNAGKAPAPTAQSLQPDGEMPDIDELRRRHDSEHEPAGPHVMQPDVAPDVPANAADVSEPPAAVLAPLEQESASTAPQTNGSRPSDDSVAEPAVVDAKPPVEPTRASVLAAFNRNRAAPSPQPQAPPPRPPTPWFAGERQAAPAEREMSDEGWEELIAGFVAGNVVWNTRRLGPEPGNHGCRAPQSVLKRYRL